MKIRFLRLIALVLTAAVLLSGCGMVDFGEYFGAVRSLVDGNAIVPYESMTYERPDMTQLRQTLDAACEAAEGDDVSAILDGIYDFYDAYDWFSTYYALADIHYCADLTDTYWGDEYNYCTQNAATVDAGLQELYRALAQSPAREKLEQEEYFGEGFFDSYEDEESVWDETFTAMLEEEARLQTRYYELSAQAADYQDDTQGYYDACADGMASLLAELIAVRQEIAEYCGYSDYPQFAEDFYFYRDYTAAEEEQLLDDIRRELVPLYRELDAGAWEATGEYASERETLNYLATAAEGMGGTVKEAHDLMKTAKLYDTGYGENKYNSSFEQYLTSYQEPFIFMNATLTAYDKLVLAHEFGHFCNDYASYGSAAGVDVSEFFSTGMEYLSLCYGGEDLTRAKMADSLGNYVEQGAYASFERQMYSLTGDALSAEGLYALYEQVALDFGFDSVGYDRREFVDVTHFYTNPMYVFSYVVSNDAAMQLYQLEQEQRGAGLELYEQNLIPDLRGNILQLVENLDRVVNLFDEVAHKFYIEQPDIPEIYHKQLQELVRQVADCAENMAIASRAFFRDLVTLRDYSQKVYLLEHQSDKTAAKLRKAVFDSELNLAHKMQINNFVEEVADIADLAEDCIDALLIFAIKREI